MKLYFYCMDVEDKKNSIENDVLNDIQMGAGAVTSRRRVFKNLCLLVLIVSVTNFFLAIVFAKIMHFNYRSWQWSVQTLGIPIFIILPAGSFVLSALLSLLPTKKRTYKQKLIPYALIILLCAQTFIFLILAAGYLNILLRH